MKLGDFTTVRRPPTPDTLKATLANVNAGVIAAKYKWQALTLFGGYEYARLSTPSDFDAVLQSGGTVTRTRSTAATPASSRATPTSIPRICRCRGSARNTALLSNLDVAAGYYYEWQNNYTFYDSTRRP